MELSTKRNLFRYDNNAPPLKKGVQIKGGHYEIICNTPNAGGFGRIYRAYGSRREKNGERHIVAVKEFFVNEFLDDPNFQHSMGYYTRKKRDMLIKEMQGNFRNEAKILSFLNKQKDRHVPIIHGSPFWDKGRLFYAMTYINGPTLTEEVKKRGPMTEERAVDYITQIGKVLYKAHRWGIIHCDVSPNNIMLENGFAKLVDFGNARSYAHVLNYDSDNEIGTPGFCPPSHLIGHRAGDIYSLAATLFFLLTGNSFPSSEKEESIKTVLEEKCVSKQTIQAILHAMFVDSAGYPSNAEVFLSELPYKIVFNTLLNYNDNDYAQRR